MKNILLFISCLLLLAGCGGNGDSGTKTSKGKENAQPKSEQPVSAKDLPQLTAEVQENEKVVEMETNKGNIKIKLFPKYAPKAVENFITHSEKGYYDGLTFHRIIKDFMIQGGDPKGDGTGGESIWGKPFKDEISNKLYHFRGALAMANAGPNTNGSQFYIVQNNKIDQKQEDGMKNAGFPDAVIKAYKERGGAPWLDGKYTIFGQVIEGMDTVDKIASFPTDKQGRPDGKIKINKITVIKD
ncbi:peptidylprolyl isomerase [Peribacillus kribbensis]|uniref:peptidylprolyl isomerase n=1 Tax=Peribacillus kribbensis TaxID=356658 RepID=UPI0004134E97|nr:peptidylprolyl isomerase [Peribacillus kribbensis]